MSEFKMDLDAIKKDIEERKNNSMVVEQAMGRTGIPKTDKRTFLANLLSSVNVGDRNNTAVQALQTLNETVESTRGVPTAVAKNLGTGRGSGEPYTPTTSLSNYKDNDAAFEREIQKRAEDMIRMNKMGQSNNTPLSEAVNTYTKAPYVGQPMNEQYVPQPTAGYGNMNEQIQRSVADVMASSMFDKMINESFRNVITEIYTKDKIETVIKEYVDSEIFKKIVATKVVDTIKQLQEIQKKKAGNV